MITITSACASWLPAPVPMHTRASTQQAGHHARCLLVMLPGLGDDDSVFIDHGFVAALRERELSVDVITAAASLGYYAQNTLRSRLEADVLGPAQRVGYDQIWFAGVSLGGFGSIMMAHDHAKELAGIILLAPYLGDDDLLDEIAQAGGVDRWQPGTIKPADYEREMWRWLKDATAHPTTAPAIYLAAADQDKLAAGHRLLAHVLAPERRFRTRGNHDWEPWQILWADFLDHSDFAARCVP
ncbi:hypothetical protein BH11MYX1_BH11MYX1_02470 [soil metagenome]